MAPGAGNCLRQRASDPRRCYQPGGPWQCLPGTCGPVSHVFGILTGETTKFAAPRHLLDGNLFM
jgi:hypothetical protein